MTDETTKTIVTQEDLLLFGMLLKKGRTVDEDITFLALCKKIGINDEIENARKAIVESTGGKKVHIDAPYNMAIDISAGEEYTIDMDLYVQDETRLQHYQAVMSEKIKNMKVTKSDLGIKKLNGNEPYVRLEKTNQRLVIKANKTTVRN